MKQPCLIKGGSIVALILEEYGHLIDAQVNPIESLGDEGAIFAQLVQGKNITAQELQALQSEDDTATIILEGETINIEQQNFTGTNGNDNITGTSVNDYLEGLGGDDSLKALGGSDILNGGDGGIGLNQLHGGDGNDIFILSGGDDYAVGGGGSETLNGGDGNDTLLGDDYTTTSTNSDGNDSLVGGVGNDYLYGAGGSDTLQGTNGGAGESDYLNGGTGSDRFVIGDSTFIGYDDGSSTSAGTGDYAEIADFNISENDVIQLKGGVNYLLSVVGADTQILIDKPSIEPDELIGIIKNRTGLSISGNYFIYSSTVTPSTLSINDVTITEGNSGTTNATFTVTRTGTGAITVNYATANDTATAGSDYTNTSGTLNFATNETSKTITVPIIGDTTVESNETFFINLTNPTNATITDNQGLGTITNDDNTTVVGIVVNGDANANDLEGGDGNDTINGLGGNDTLTGFAGADALFGGAGNDIYYVDDTTDVVSETNPDGTDASGIDTIYATVSYTVPNFVEKLILEGASNLNGTGNTLNDTIIGNRGNNLLIGNFGNDILSGGKGSDTLNGGAGNDSYYVDSLTDVIIDSAGKDTVISSLSYTLASYLENLTLSGSVNLDGTGNTANNKLIGNTGANTLIGDAGNDTLTGGAGNDSFRFNAKTEGIDTITDFNVANDTIIVAKSGFSSDLTANAAITTTQFTLGASATTATQRFGYNSSTGSLWFDSDGSGSTASIQFATLSTGLALTNADIFVEN